MPLPQAVAGQMLDVRRQLAFRNDIEVNILVLFNSEGEELVRIDHFWLVYPPKVRFGESHETVQFLVVEDEEADEPALDEIMAETRSLRYIMSTFDAVPVETFSEVHRCTDIPTPPLGRNRQWDIRTTTATNVSEFFRPPGE